MTTRCFRFGAIAPAVALAAFAAIAIQAAPALAFTCDSSEAGESADGATAFSIYDLACGHNASADGGGLETNAATALGANAAATATTSIAVGVSSLANSSGGSAVGAESQATALGASAFGAGSQATNISSTALGHSSEASGAFSVAIGFNSEASSDNSIAIGVASHASTGRAIAIGEAATATNTNAIAQGYQASASEVGSIALGAGAQATAANAVAIGAGSVAGAANTVSFGSAGNERRLTNVAAGVDPTDAVNVSQLQDVTFDFESRFNGVEEGVAMAMALSGGATLPQGKTFGAAINLGTFAGQNALALSSAWRLSANAILSGGISYGFASQQVGGRVGVQVAW